MVMAILDINNLQFVLLVLASCLANFIVFSFSFFKKKIYNFIVNLSFSASITLIALDLARESPKEVSWAEVTPFVSSMLMGITYFSMTKNNNVNKKEKYCFTLNAGTQQITFADPFDNFLVYGGANAGKTKSIGKPLLEQYIINKFAGFIYDYKDFDYTKTAYNLCKKHNYPFDFYYVSFTDLTRSYRFNPIKPEVLGDENLLMQLMDDFLSSCQEEKAKRDEWFGFGLGVLKGTAYRFYKDYPQYCTLPHIANFVIHAGKERLTKFLLGSPESKALASGFIDSQDSERTQASIMGTLTNTLSKVAFNKNIMYVLSGDDFDFDLIDPKRPKLLSVCNSFAIEGSISPIIAMLMSISTRKFTMENKVPFVYFLDEATTFKIRDFEKLPSVLREYLCSFVLLTQSGAKLEKIYSKLDRSSVESNFSNMFLGRTKDPEALKYYPIFFGKHEIDKKSRTTGSSSNSSSHSVTVSSVKEERYEGHFFTRLLAGEFVGSAAHSNFGDFHLRFNQYNPGYEEEIPVVNPVLPSDVQANYEKILEDIFSIE